MKADEVAVQKMVEGFNCAQAVLYARGDTLGVAPHDLVKLASGFGAGMGRKGEVCGALTGGIIALGAGFGRGENDDRAATEETYGKTRELMDRFQAVHGAVLCRDLLNGADLNTPEGQQYYKDNNLSAVCQKCVQTVSLILEDML